jgi:hypothetical protein
LTSIGISETHLVDALPPFFFLLLAETLSGERLLSQLFEFLLPFTLLSLAGHTGSFLSFSLAFTSRT